MAKEKEVSFLDLQKKLMGEVWKDESMREKIRKDPKKTIEKVLGLHFPADVNISVIDQTNQKSLTFVLPPKKESATSVELSEEEMGAVAGGANKELYIGFSELGDVTIIRTRKKDIIVEE